MTRSSLLVATRRATATATTAAKVPVGGPQQAALVRELRRLQMLVEQEQKAASDALAWWIFFRPTRRQSDHFPQA